MTQLLIVEDETDLVDLLEYHLHREGFQILRAGNATEGLRLAKEQRPAFVVLDLMLPDLPGTEVCRRLREDPATATACILMLTARGTEQERVAGFEAGADDYVTKPFSMRELLLRLRAHQRRASMAPALGNLTFGQLQLDPVRHRCFVDGTEVKLTAMEFRLLQYLMTNPERAFTRDDLLRNVWGTGEEETRTLDTHVLRVRDKLGNARGYIQTVRGVGYRLAVPTAE
jgi:two-component system phosphate regulon response regulator PhoB